MKVNNEVFYKNDIFLWNPLNLIDIKSPADLKGLSLAELTELTAQARQALMTKVSEHGGHYQSYGICIWHERCHSFRVL